MTEEVILEGCLRNDSVAQRELYNTYSPKMLAVCFRYAHSREDAEDMLQEAFLLKAGSDVLLCILVSIHLRRIKNSMKVWI